jgi:alkylated DNA repair protein (DNA oxidative demethylase)
MERPEGLVYEAELLTPAEERALLGRIEQMDFAEIRMHGVVAKRTARHFGLDYDYERRGVLEEADPIPPRRECAFAAMSMARARCSSWSLRRGRGTC